MSFFARCLILLSCLMVVADGWADDQAQKLAFFETNIRPVLIEACYECHSVAGKQEGSLTLDHRAGLLRGGDRGPAIIPGDAEKSLFMAAIRHTEDDLHMPRGGAKLKPAVIADFTRWIKDGAVDPRDKPPTPEELAKATAWEQVRERRRQWWSFQPLQLGPLPTIAEVRWLQPVDRFIRAKQLEAKLTPAAKADDATLLRRATLLITGVPPTAEEVRQYLADPAAIKYAQAVDRLLASPRFGETWARHWMDWFRYAESHGSEGDPAIPHAWRYRDYLIRALNNDVSYQQLVREHIAGDLLPEPRINKELGLRESALGIGHLRMVQHGYAPTDALDDRVRAIDNQIDVLSKAFLGLTVSCARCHHHKFDPISQDDFYAWYGVFANGHPGTIVVDTPERLAKNKAELTALKPRIKNELAQAWLGRVQQFSAELQAAPIGKSEETVAKSTKEPLGWKESLVEAASKGPDLPLAAWHEAQVYTPEVFAERWKKRATEIQVKPKSTSYALHWKLNGPDYQRWYHNGNGLPNQPSPAGEFHLQAEGERAVANIYPAGAYTHGLSNKHAGVLISPRFKIECDEILVRIAGGSNARVRYVVQNYPRVVLIYPHSQLETETAKWFKWDARYWKGEHAHIEIVTGDDQPIDIGSNQGRSWFGAVEVIGKNRDEPMPAESNLSLLAMLTEEERRQPPASSAALAKLYATVLQRTITAWQSNTLTDAQAEWLGFFVRRNLLPNTLPQLPTVAPLVAEYRQLEKEVIVPTRAPGVHEGEPFDQPLYVRGNHLQPSSPVPRRYLEVFDPQPYASSSSARLQLAASMSDPQHPLLARVIVNRVWLHLMGRGLVATPDNFGHLGEEPTHPELLDYLAAQFSGRVASDGLIQPWSLKSFIRTLVMSETFQQSSTSSTESKEHDADNRLLTRFRLRRLPAEAIRDSLVAVSVGLDDTMYGPSVANNSFRRGVYLPMKRNSLDPFLTTFDEPEPVSTTGRRDATNVPAQSLTLLNDPFVIQLAQTWATRVLNDATLPTDEARVRALLFAAVGREPTRSEVEASLRYLQRSETQRAAAQEAVAKVQERLTSLQRTLEEQLAPVRTKLLAAREKGDISPRNLPQPIARWEFEGDLRDANGSLHGQVYPIGKDQPPLTAEQQASFVKNGALMLDGQHYVKTPKLATGIAAKTLEAWVQLDSLEQRGGGVISLETPGGAEFDSLVFGEQEPRRWLAGSEFFRRTKGLGGPAEGEALSEPVHVALVYSADGKITFYRQGQPHGEAYSSKGPYKFTAGQAQVLFGLRHSPAGNGKLLSGRIHRAQLYDRALTAEEIAATSGAVREFISRDELLAALSPAEQTKISEMDRELAKLNKELEEHTQRDSARPDRARVWRDLCQSLFNWKEFLYVH